MKDCFFTFGGRIFWEDLFVKYGWRIQRNLTSHKFRLLDNFNIVRFEGNFKKTKAEFDKYVEAYELREIITDKKIVIMLHGYAQSGKIFQQMSNYLRTKDIDAQAIEYPSTQRGITGNAKQINILLDNIDDYKEISFITFGIGNIILEKALQQRMPKQKNAAIGKIIEIAPATGNNFILQKITQTDFFKFIFGDIPSCINDKAIESFHYIPQATIGVIKTKSDNHSGLLASFFSTKERYEDIEEIKKWCGAKEVLSSDLNKKEILKNKSIFEAVYRFLNSGKFK